MVALNNDRLREQPVHAATDVTGFGLLGHLLEMARGSRLGFRIEAAKVKFFDGVLELAAADSVPAGSRANLENARSAGMRFADSVSEHVAVALADAQTSGGLLIAIAPAFAQDLLSALSDARAPDVSVVGTLTKELSYSVV
jgi:selenide, water dikinase